MAEQGLQWPLKADAAAAYFVSAATAAIAAGTLPDCCPSSVLRLILVLMLMHLLAPLKELTCTA